MFISRQLAHKLINRMQMITSAIELGRQEAALQHVREMSELVKRHTESELEEKARKARTHEC